MAWQRKGLVGIAALLLVVTALTICSLTLEAFQLDWRQFAPQRLRGKSPQADAPRPTTLDPTARYVPVTDENIPDSNDHVSSADLLHLSLLHEICMESKEAVVPWQYGAPRNGSDQDTAEDRKLVIEQWDPELLSKLQQCPDIDIYVPKGIRGHGYCEDGVAYTKYLHSRILPEWVFTGTFYDPAKERNVTYYEICPKTPILYFNHYWNDVPKLSKDKPMYLMPNIEMYELRETHLWRADVVLCKTMSCQNRVTQWYKQEGNPRNTQVIYTKHTTSDVASFARHRMAKNDPTAVIKAKDYEHVHFIHTVGNSYWKGTRELLQCWLSRPDLPPLDLYIHGNMYERLHSRIKKSKNIHLSIDRLDAVTFGRTMAESAFFLCPSQMEGYGHYINQARAAGGVILTTELEPMTELVPSADMGVYVHARAAFDQETFLGGRFRGPHGLRNVPGLLASFSSRDLCSSVDKVVAMSVQDRQDKATKIQRQYHLDTKFFAASMVKLREFARGGSAANSIDADVAPDAGHEALNPRPLRLRKAPFGG